MDDKWEGAAFTVHGDAHNAENVAMTSPQQEARDRIAKLRADAFWLCAPELLDLAEKAGYENFKQRMESAAAISSQSATAVALLVAGLGAALAYASKLLDPSPGALAMPAAALCLWWSALAALATHFCLGVRPVPTAYNEPENLMVPAVDLRQVRIGELARLQQRIDDLADLNASKARWLNGIRYGMAASPVIAMLVGRYL